MLPAAGSATAATQDGPAPAGRRTATPVKEYDITLVTGDVVHYTDGPGKQDTVTVERPDGAFGGGRARFKTPKKTGAFVSLKAHAEAADGLGVDQEIIRAFGLK
ncbi:hypothetical protein [Streptomyces sp. NPDC057545]|uniref:hypothetical protein n=1 Tax=Streptomyces sp. NPDC057545 TaxID=3346164 RepID=UPI0036AD393B